MKINKVPNNNKRKFSNAKDFYYTIESITNFDGTAIDLMFTKRELLNAQERYKDFIKKSNLNNNI